DSKRCCSCIQLLKKIVKINNSSNRVNKQDLELFNNKLQKQQQQNEALQPLVRVDGGVVNEVKLLHKESRNMNSRVTQLYMQLLHEIIHQRDNALEASQMGSLTAGYRDHEHKYQHLSALLEEHCKRGGLSYGVHQERSHPAHPHLPVICPNSMTNEIQNDQNSKDLPSSSPTMSTIPPPTGGAIEVQTPAGPFKDCLQVLKSGYTTSYMYLLKPEKSTDPNSQTVIQRRQDGSVNCFGNIDIEYWLRLENIYWLTNQGNYKLLVNLEDWRGQKTFAEYASFRQYQGNAGDSLTWHNNRNCAHYYKGGCILYLGGHHRSRYHDGVYWIKFRGGAYSLWKVSMMIQPNANTVD
uniref:Fibrinogen C-terminal domain-containing protein n=1 Tax=Mola mola TaxID=94237 RepID=A0A3Q3W991_MOLML